MVAHIPIPIDIRIGMVIGPVVTPPESNTIPRYCSGAKNDSARIMAYPAVRMMRMGTFSTIFRVATTTKLPTPNAITIVSRNPSISGYS
ncbi:MAG: hypothetical protein WCQ23_05415 [Candidatus Methanomethylophilaceae archaeon]|mgnify:FL=1|jgi:hypothetical protein